MKKIDIIIFDVDSTLVTIEGLDWLAEKKGRKSEVSRFTKRSMEGLMGFRDAMERKMKIISPTRRDLAALGEKYCWSLTPGAEDIVRLLHKLGKQVWLLTGNFQPAVGILAKKLGVPATRILCNEVYFDSLGNYAGFNSGNKLSRDNGKAETIKELFANKKKVAFIGDSVTDLEAKEYVRMFIGFGGVAERKAVRENADYYIGEPDLSPVLSLVLTRAEKKLLMKLKPSVASSLC